MEDGYQSPKFKKTTTSILTLLELAPQSTRQMNLPHTYYLESTIIRSAQYVEALQQKIENKEQYMKPNKNESGSRFEQGDQDT